MKPIPYMLVAATALIPSALNAGNCHQLFHHRPHVQQVVAVPVVQNYFHAVGENLLLEALVDKRVQQLQAQGKLQAVQQPVERQQVGSTLAAKCTRCHGEGKQAGGVDFRYSLSDYHFRRTVEMLGEGIDVPEAMKSVIAGLSPAEKGGITSEAIRLPAKPEEPAVAPSPMDEEGRLR